jgi:hypothetical protein
VSVAASESEPDALATTCVVLLRLPFVRPVDGTALLVESRDSPPLTDAVLFLCRSLFFSCVCSCLCSCVHAGEILTCVAASERELVVGSADGMLHVFPLLNDAGRSFRPVGHTHPATPLTCPVACQPCTYLCTIRAFGCRMRSDDAANRRPRRSLTIHEREVSPARLQGEEDRRYTCPTCRLCTVRKRTSLDSAGPRLQCRAYGVRLYSTAPRRS